MLFRSDFDPNKLAINTMKFKENFRKITNDQNIQKIAEAIITNYVVENQKLKLEAMTQLRYSLLSKKLIEMFKKIRMELPKILSNQELIRAKLSNLGILVNTMPDKILKLISDSGIYDVTDSLITSIRTVQRGLQQMKENVTTSSFKGKNNEELEEELKKGMDYDKENIRLKSEIASLRDAINTLKEGKENFYKEIDNLSKSTTDNKKANIIIERKSDV